MLDPYGAIQPYPIALVTQTPTQIQVLAMQKIAFVEAANGLPGGARQQHQGAGDRIADDRLR